MAFHPMSETDSSDHPKVRRGIYLLPNLFTTACLFSGFYAILAAMKGQYEAASIAVFVAMVMDGLDGRVARLTHTQSEFGAEYDSLSDMVAFGLAPALVVYVWALSGLGKLGWLAAFIYTACTALRLARFNTQIGIADKRYFQGLPSPSAAAIIASGVWLATAQDMTGADLAWIALVLTVVLGLLMVGNLRFHSFKQIDFRGRVSFIVAVVVMLGFALIFFHPPLVLFLGFLAYAVSGPVLTLQQLRHRRTQRQHGPRAQDRR
jgi:CDP-diacylglycerol--serine O-phosphatidyltransferase